MVELTGLGKILTFIATLMRKIKTERDIRRVLRYYTSDQSQWEFMKPIIRRYLESDKMTYPAFIDGKFLDPKDCPKSNKGRCVHPECGNVVCELEYGFCNGFGLGGFKRCPLCGTPYDFKEDKDE